MPAPTTTSRFAFYVRVWTEDAQDPSLSTPRQLAPCERALEPGGGEIVARYWDIESGRKALAERGRGAEASAVAVPRKGGLNDLLDAPRNGRPFDAVIVESIDRLSRMTADGTRIERQLEDRDIALFAADEPMTANASAILTRRVKQGVAEWYARDLIEKSRRGIENRRATAGTPAARFRTATSSRPTPTPTPTRHARARKKHRLVPDPVRAPIVATIFEDYCLRGMGLGEIGDKLNRDLEPYPPPKATARTRCRCARPGAARRSRPCSATRSTPATTSGAATTSAGAGRFQRPREQWVWSPAPAHQPLVLKEPFEVAEERARRNEARRRNRRSTTRSAAADATDASTSFARVRSRRS